MPLIDCCAKAKVDAARRPRDVRSIGKADKMMGYRVLEQMGC